MDEIIFKNGQEPALNDVTLNKLQKNIKPNKIQLTIPSTLESGVEITLPIYYRVGTGCLDVYLNGERLILSSDASGTDGHYQEVGVSGEISNKIKSTTDWNFEAGDVLDLEVRGEYNET